MFCNNCGKKLTDDASFCDACGTKVVVATDVSTESASNTFQTSTNPILGDALTTLKGFFSKDTVKTVGKSAKSQGMEWLIIASISMIVYAFALAANVKQVINYLLGSMASLFGDEIYNFGSCFLYGLLISAGTYFLMSLAIYAAMRFLLKKDISVKNILNLVATASLPLTTAHLINIALGFVWMPFVVVFLTVSLIATAVLLYVGMQKATKLDKSPFVTYLGIWIAVVLVVIIFINLVTKSIISNTANDLVDSLGNGLFSGGISNLFDMFG